MQGVNCSYPARAAKDPNEGENQMADKFPIDNLETIKKILGVSYHSLVGGDKAFDYVRSSNGSTGITYISQIQRQALVNHNIPESSLPIFARLPNEEDRESQKGLNFILKYVNKDNAANEKYCSELFKQFQFNAPDLAFVGSELISARSTGRDLMRAMHRSELGDNGELVFMFAFEGADFNSMLKLQSFFNLTDESFKNLLADMGEIAVFDLLIGNDDRFFRNQETNPRRIQSFCNYGNIMFKLKWTEDAKHELVETYSIDNATSARLKPKVARFDTESDEESQSLFGLFGNGSSNDRDDVEDDIPMDVPCVLHADRADNTPSSFAEAFSYYTSAENKEEFIQILADGYLKSIKSYTPKDIAANAESIFLNELLVKECFGKGYDRAMTKLAVADTSQIFRDLDLKTDSDNPYCQVTKEMLQFCLRIKQEIL